MSTSKTQAPEFIFRELTIEAYNSVGIDPLPFPMRATEAASGFNTAPINLSFLLQELQHYTNHNPDQMSLYQRNIEKLSMINATNLMNSGDAKDALKSLGYGIRANPRNNSLRLHHALALQVNGYHDLAAIEYDAILEFMPYALDPAIRALAAKAHMAMGDKEGAFAIINGLAETAFVDPDLNALRRSLAPNGWSPPDQTVQAIEACNNCGTARDGNSNYCKKCGVGFEVIEEQFCRGCGALLEPGKRFCTKCGTKA